jgi:hypothetical protein
LEGLDRSLKSVELDFVRWFEPIEHEAKALIPVANCFDAISLFPNVLKEVEKLEEASGKFGAFAFNLGKRSVIAWY